MEKARHILKGLTAVLMVTVLLACMVPTAFTGFEDEIFESGGYLYSLNADKTVMIHAYSGKSKNITIPSKLDGKKVTALGESIGYLNVETIKIPAGITLIEGGAFTGAPKLKSFTVDKANKKFTAVNGILYSKDKKELVQYPFGKEGTSFTVPTGTEIIGAVAFYGCYNLGKIALPDSVRVIGASAFAGTGISTFAIPDGVKEIGFNAFSMCDALTEITIPGTVSVINMFAFDNCTSLKKINFLGSEAQWKKVRIDSYNSGLEAAEVSFVEYKGAVKTVKASAIKDTSIKFSWSKVSDASGYKVELYKGKKLEKTVYTTKTAYTFKSLKKGTSYKVNVTAYKNVNGGKAYGTGKTVSATTKVAKVTLSSVKSTKAKQIDVAWKTVSGANGYKVTYSTSKKFTKKTTKTVTVKKQKTKKTSIKKLKKGKTYYVKVAAYKTVSGKAVLGAYSAVKTVKVK